MPALSHAAPHFGKRAAHTSGALHRSARAPTVFPMDETPGMVRYRKLTALWMSARERAGGKLTQEQEARWAGAIDRVWVRLSEDEQDALEAAAAPSRPPHP